MTEIHRLKTKEPFYTLVRDGFKDFEIRKNDRYFEAGDYLILVPEPPPPAPIEAVGIVRRIKYIMRSFEFEQGLKDNMVALGLQVPTEQEAALILELEYAQMKAEEYSNHRCW